MSYSIWSNRRMVVVITWLLVFGVYGCQTGALSFQGRAVQSENRVIFPIEGTSAGSWQTRDMTIDYQLTRKAEGVQLTGTLHWANHIRYNFNQVRVSLRANFFDGQDTITGGQAVPVLSFRRLEESPQINVLLNAMPTDRGLAFSYSGRATDGGTTRRGRGDAIDFSIWHTP